MNSKLARPPGSNISNEDLIEILAAISLATKCLVEILKSSALSHDTLTRKK